MGIKWSVIFIGLKLAIVIILLTSCSTHGIASEESRMELAKLSTNYTTVTDILLNPDKFDGNMVQVGGWVSSLRFVNSRNGAYTYFLLGDQSGKTISFVSLGIYR